MYPGIGVGASYWLTQHNFVSKGILRGMHVTTAFFALGPYVAGPKLRTSVSGSRIVPIMSAFCRILPALASRGVRSC